MPNITQMIRQGQWEVEMGINVGVMVFDLTAIRNQFATHSPVRATLALNRTGSGAHGSAINLMLYAGNQTGMPPATQNVSTPAARPTRVSSVFTTNISAGQGSKSFSISTALITSIGNGNSNCLFMDADASFAHYMSFTGRNNLSQIRLTIEWAQRTTAATAPTNATVSPTIAEGNATLSWSGASGGLTNGITGYDVQFSDSTNNSAWGAWQDLTTVATTATSGSLSVAPPSTRGNFRRFRVRTRGAAGASFFSGWRVTSNSVRRNTWPNAPTTVIASPEIYSDESVTLTWAGASPGLSAIRGFQTARRTSTDNQTWGNWVGITQIDLAATGGTATPNVSRTPGTYTQFAVWTIDVLGTFSVESISNSILNIKRDVPPLAPLIAAPRNNSVIYNTKPMILLQTQPEPDGQPQTLYVRIGNGAWHNTADHPEYFTTGGELDGNARTVYTSDELPPGNHTIETHTTDGGYDSPTVTRNFTILASPFDTIIFNQTHVQARHILDLRTAANNVRNYYGLTAYAWGMEIEPGKTLVAYWPFHILELRAALEAVMEIVNNHDAAHGGLVSVDWQNIVDVENHDTGQGDAAAVDWQHIGTGRPRAAVMNQFRDLILGI